MRHRTLIDKHPGEKVDARGQKTGFGIVHMQGQSAADCKMTSRPSEDRTIGCRWLTDSSSARGRAVSSAVRWRPQFRHSTVHLSRRASADRRPIPPSRSFAANVLRRRVFSLRSIPVAAASLRAMSGLRDWQFVAGAAATGRTANENAAVGRVQGTAVPLRPFRRREGAIRAALRTSVMSGDFVRRRAAPFDSDS